MDRVHRKTDDDQRSIVASGQAWERFGRKPDPEQDDCGDRKTCRQQDQRRTVDQGDLGDRERRRPEQTEDGRIDDVDARQPIGRGIRGVDCEACAGQFAGQSFGGRTGRMNTGLSSIVS